LFTWGINEIGHSDSTSVPKMINDKSLKDLFFTTTSCNRSAIYALTRNGELYACLLSKQPFQKIEGCDHIFFSSVASYSTYALLLSRRDTSLKQLCIRFICMNRKKYEKKLSILPLDLLQEFFSSFNYK